LKQSELIAALVSHTGTLEPSDSTTHAELADLRRSLISSLLAGQPDSDIGTSLDSSPGGPELIKELSYLTADPQLTALQPSAATTTRVARRPSPLAVSVAAGVAAAAASNWATGLRPARTFGPFVDKTGRPWWFDTFTFSNPLEVRRSGASNDFLVLPKGVTGSGISQRYSIPAGTIWIASQQFAPQAPANTFAGIRIKSGVLTIAGVGGLADPLIIAADAAVTLTIVRDPSSQSGPATGPGLDATNAAANFPVSASFVFGASGIESISAEGASVTAYGSTIQLTRNANAALWDSAIGQILIPFTADKTGFSIAAVSSSSFQPAGTATIAQAAWAFAVTPAGTVSAGATAGTGALAIVVQAGLTATWPGLAEGPFNSIKPIWNSMVHCCSSSRLAHRTCAQIRLFNSGATASFQAVAS
jgi:hypothetical protein